MDSASSKPEELRERHVCFKSSVAETNQSWFPRKSRSSDELSGPACCGCPQTGSSLVVSSMAALNSGDAGSPGPSEFFPEEPAMPPNPFLGRRGHGGFGTYPDLAPLVTSVTTSVEDYVHVDSDGGGDAGGALSWLRNFLIGVLVAALLVAVASAGGVMDWTGSAAFEQRITGGRSRTPSSPDEMQLVEERLTVGAPQLPAGPALGVYAAASSREREGSDIRWNSTMTGIPTWSIAAGIDGAGMPASVAGADLGREGAPPPNYPPMSKMWRRECGHYFYTYCESIRQEWYHKPSAHGCVATTSDSVHVCNRGANRFANLEACFASCVHGDRKPDRCFESALFTECDRADVVATWWFFDGRRCQRWNFPLGSCPSEKGDVFRSLHHCVLECLPQKGGQPLNATARMAAARRCEVPVAATCSARQLRYPYFADMRAEGSSRCVRASVASLLTRRCLVGSNRFTSHATCSRFCSEPEPGK